VEPIKLARLLRGFPFVEVKGSKEVLIRGLSNDSRKTAPGDLFIACNDSYIEQALMGGAVAVVCQSYNPFISVPQIVTTQIKELQAYLAEKFYKNPSKKLYLAGITGTNGKSTISFGMKTLFDYVKRPAGVIGTLGYFVGDSFFDPELTTPDILTTTRLLKEMQSKNQNACAMEVSSHALEQQRVLGLHFDMAIFSQLTPDHLDYHETMEKYAAAKKKLFQALPKEGVAILNADCPYSSFMGEGIQAKKLTYGIDNKADVTASNVQVSLDELTFDLEVTDGKISCRSSLFGKFNLYNLLAVASAAVHLGLSLDQIQEVIQLIQPIPGRMQKIDSDQPIHLFIDYAHTEKSLENVLKQLKSCAKKKIITVFGCGGKRYQEKRAKMGSISDRYSDITILTSDNPRDEDPLAIIRQIQTGFTTQTPIVCPDRKEAISHAVAIAEKGDIVLIAGKGHEKVQIFAHNTVPFDDSVIAKNALESLKDACFYSNS
jgi:UDP-N-acetylmuramoyl-L-alanyl-D-glutamate--2,6-diaminopimelate ligase